MTWNILNRILDESMVWKKQKHVTIVANGLRLAHGSTKSITNIALNKHDKKLQFNI